MSIKEASLKYYTVKGRHRWRFLACSVTLYIRSSNLTIERADDTFKVSKYPEDGVHELGEKGKYRRWRTSLLQKSNPRVRQALILV